MKIVGKGQILFCLFLDQEVQVSADILAKSVEEINIFAHFCCLFLHEGALQFVVSLKTSPNAKMYLFIIDICAPFAYGLALLPLAEGAQGSFADTRPWEVILGTVPPSLQISVDLVQSFLKKHQHRFLISFRMKTSDDIGKQTLRFHCQILFRINIAKNLIDRKRIRSLYINILLNDFMKIDLLCYFMLSEVIRILGFEIGSLFFCVGCIIERSFRDEDEI